MDTIDRPVTSKAKAKAKAKAKIRRASVRPPKDEGVLINMTVGGGTAQQTADAAKRLAALSRRVKVGKRVGATEVVRAERA